MQRHRGGKSLRLSNAEGKGRERRARRNHPVCSPHLMGGPEERGDVTGSFQKSLWLPRREWDGIQGAREETKRQAQLSRPEATPSIQDTWYQSPGCCVSPARPHWTVLHIVPDSAPGLREMLLPPKAEANSHPPGKSSPGGAARADLRSLDAPRLKTPRKDPHVA